MIDRLRIASDLKLQFMVPSHADTAVAWPSLLPKAGKTRVTGGPPPCCLSACERAMQGLLMECASVGFCCHRCPAARLVRSPPGWQTWRQAGPWGPAPPPVPRFDGHLGCLSILVAGLWMVALGRPVAVGPLAQGAAGGVPMLLMTVAVRVDSIHSVLRLLIKEPSEGLRGWETTGLRLVHQGSCRPLEACVMRLPVAPVPLGDVLSSQEVPQATLPCLHLMETE